MSKDWPDWQDLGRRVEMVDEHGATIVGALTYEDMGSDGQGGEWPILLIKDEGGALHGFAANKSWRYL